MREDDRHEAEHFGGPINRNNQLRKNNSRKWKREDEPVEARNMPDVEVVITIKRDTVEIRLG